MKKLLNHATISCLLDEYNNKVKKSTLKKSIPYSTWRDLIRSSMVEVCLEHSIITITAANGNVFTTNIEDGGFGTFLKSYMSDKNTAECEPAGLNGPIGAPAKLNAKELSVNQNSFDALSQKVNKLENKMNNNKENDIMKGFNFDFGPCTNDDIRMSMYGLAVKNAEGVWVSYNPNSNQIVDVDIFNFDGRKFMFKMPVAVNDIMIGDIIIHNRTPMFVIDADKEAIKAVDVRAGERKEIIPTVSPFGFNFITKIVSMFDSFNNGTSSNSNFFGTPSENNPFGNPMMFMLMGDSENGENMNMKDILLMSMFMNSEKSMDMSNPLMMMLLMDKMD